MPVEQKYLVKYDKCERDVVQLIECEIILKVRSLVLDHDNDV